MSTDISSRVTAGAPAEAIMQPSRGRIVLVATDTTSASAPALRVAFALAGRGEVVHALHVVDTRSAPIPPPLDMAIALVDASFGDSFREARQQEVRSSIATTLGTSVDWPATIALGTPSAAIAGRARALGADLVVVGLRRHHAVERALGDETSLHVMQASPCPVIAAGETLRGFPKRVLVAVDFSQASLEAARAADRLVGRDATLVLAYVAPAELDIPDDGERVIHELGVDAAFTWFRRELGRADNAPTEQVTLRRWTAARVGEVLLSYADSAKIDMLALGSVRHGRIERWMVGSVTTDVARDGRHSMLVVPPDTSSG